MTYQLSPRVFLERLEGLFFGLSFLSGIELPKYSGRHWGNKSPDPWAALRRATRTFASNGGKMENDYYGYSPDIGKFVRRNDKVYTSGGEIINESAGGPMFREIPSSAAFFEENFADWTDEQRAQKRAERDRAVAEEKERMRVAAEKRRALIESARKKLEPEEFDAIVEQATIDERGYE